MIRKLADAIASKEDSNSLGQILGKVLVLEGTEENITSAAIGLNGNYIEFGSETITIVCNGRRVTICQLIDAWEQYQLEEHERELELLAAQERGELDLSATDADFEV